MNCQNCEKDLGDINEDDIKKAIQEALDEGHDIDVLEFQILCELCTEAYDAGEVTVQ